MIKIKLLEILTSEEHEKLEDKIQKLLTEKKIEAKIFNEDTGNVMVSPRMEDGD